MAPTSDSSSNSDSNSQSQKDQSSPSNDSSSSSASDNQNNGGSSDNNNGGNSDNNNGGNSDNSGGGDSNNNDGNSNNNNNNNGGNSNNSNNGGNSNNDNNGGNSDNNNNGGNSDNNGGKSDSNNNGGNSDNNNNGGNSNNNNNGGNSDNNNNGGNSDNNNNGGNSNNNNNGGNSNNNNNGGNSNNNNNGGNSSNDNNSSSQSSPNSSQGNWSPPKSSNGKWSPPPALGSSNKSPATSLDTSNDSSPPSRSNSNSTTPLIVGVVAAAGILLLLMILLCLACSKKKKKRRMHHENNPIGGGSDYWQSGPYKSNEHVMNMPPPHGGWQSGHAPPAMMSSDMSSAYNSGPHGPALPPPHPSVALGFNKSTFSYEELAVATSGFAQAKLLGQGGFGYVHKGVLPNGKEIAVKSLKAGSGQGDREFAAEVEIISRVHHRHLVSLVGYCLSGERKLLVYEFVPNNNLEFHLHGKGRPPLDWASRIKIALGSAKGLAYLHEDCHPKIIHRDIKTANILIDDNFEAKVADFGLAKLNEANETHVSTRIMGTFGYLAPEYASSGKLTEKSDVFSFGIMLLELITGRRPIDTTGDYEEDTLVDWARPLCQRAIEDGNFSELADPRLEKNYNPEEMARMIACAAASTRQAGRKRPKMSQIVRALEGDVSMEDLSEGVKPGQRGFFGSSGTSSEFDRDSYNENMKQFRKTALNDSTDYPSSEYGDTSSDHSQEIERKAGASRMDSPA